MGRMRQSITYRLRSISDATAMLVTLFDEEDIVLERPHFVNDLYDIDGQMWGLIRDIEQYRSSHSKQSKEG